MVVSAADTTSKAKAVSTAAAASPAIAPTSSAPAKPAGASTPHTDHALHGRALALVFFGLPFLGIHFPSFQILGVDFERLSAGVLALIINSGAYECEIVRSGIQSIPKGQLEGAMSLGFSKWESMIRIIIPQAIRNILPVIGNEFVTLIKESSQVSVIGMADLMYTATTIQGISFQPFPPLVIVALYYFIMTFFVSMCLKVFERRLKVKSVR